MTRNIKFSISKPFLKQIQKAIDQTEQSSFVMEGEEKKKERWKRKVTVLPAVQKLGNYISE